MIINDHRTDRTGILVLYDRRALEARERAGSDRKVWGRGLADMHPMRPDHVLIEFRADGALETAS